jgi:CopG family nickel-responsive transcriptional regulator
MPVISVSLPDDLLVRVDDVIKTTGAKGRSELVRAALRAYTLPAIPSGHAHGSITIAYPHGEEARISEVRHAFHDVVLSMMHTHCDPGQCMDVLLVGGEATRVAELQRTLERMRQVQRAALTLVPKPKAGASGDVR